MKRAAVLFAAVLTVALLTSQANAAGLYPVFVEEYTYGPFDELRVDMVYVLSRSDDPANIPTGDFDRRGYHFTLLCVEEIGQSEIEAKWQAVTTSRDTVIYTATFVCRDEAKTSTRPFQVPIGQDHSEEGSSFDLSPQAVLLTLFRVTGLIFVGSSIKHYIKSKKERGV